MCGRETAAGRCDPYGGGCAGHGEGRVAAAYSRTLPQKQGCGQLRQSRVYMYGGMGASGVSSCRGVVAGIALNYSRALPGG